MAYSSKKNSSNVDDSGVFRKLNAFEKQYGYILADTMERLGEIGAKEMRRVIENSTSPFGASTKGNYPQLGPVKGRIRTGKMLRSVGSKITVTGKYIRAVIGYIRGQKEPYYSFQDQGFWNVWKMTGFDANVASSGKIDAPNAPPGFQFERTSKRWTKGTHALREARQLMKDKSPAMIRAAEKKIVQKAGGRK